MLSIKDSYGNIGSFKYFTGYINNCNAFPIPLCIKLPQINGYVKNIDNNNKYVNLLVHDKKLSKQYNEIWSKFRKLLKKGLIVSHCMMLNSLKLK